MSHPKNSENHGGIFKDDLLKILKGHRDDGGADQRA